MKPHAFSHKIQIAKISVETNAVTFVLVPEPD